MFSAAYIYILTKTHEPLLGLFERKILRRVYGAVQFNEIWQRYYNFKFIAFLKILTDIVKRIIINSWRGWIEKEEGQ